jgi:pSer/pThr/pTyr-binding forkhead associated (FHA) protein
MSDQDSNTDNQTQRTFLIVDGNRVIFLDQPVTNIGRKADNDIVIDDQHVSRFHAQIRDIQGRFVLFDLDSTVGTSVNGRSIKQKFLKPGDVISVGGVPLIFGQGNPKADQVTSPIDPDEINTGPTDATDIQLIDNYLDLFNTPDYDDE